MATGLTFSCWGITPCDYASVSEAVWPLFAAKGCERQGKSELIQKGVLRSLELEYDQTKLCTGTVCICIITVDWIELRKLSSHSNSNHGLHQLAIFVRVSIRRESSWSSNHHSVTGEENMDWLDWQFSPFLLFCWWSHVQSWSCAAPHKDIKCTRPQLLKRLFLKPNPPVNSYLLYTVSCLYVADPAVKKCPSAFSALQHDTHCYSSYELRKSELHTGETAWKRSSGRARKTWRSVWASLKLCSFQCLALYRWWANRFYHF